MIPNWLLGKSKSKLQEILGGGGGGTTYTAGEGIDITENEISVDPVLLSDISDVSDAIPLKAAKTQITNPNILHNPWFQVNQRGVTTSTSTGYFVDRWLTYKPSAGTATFTLNSDGTITIDNSLGEKPAYFVQKRTSKTMSRVAGKTITMSVMLSDGSVRSGSGIYSDTEAKNYYTDDDIRLQSNPQTHGEFFLLRIESGKTVTIKALKFEIGEISTLAMDTAPDMATELLKCQRYFQRISGVENALLGICYSYSSTKSTLTISLPVLMRATPSLTKSGTFKIGGNIVSAMSATALSANILTLDLTSSSLAEYAAARLFFGASAYIDLSAEL